MVLRLVTDTDDAARNNGQAETFSDYLLTCRGFIAQTCDSGRQ